MNPDFPRMLGCPFCGGNPTVMTDRVGTSNLFDCWIECYQCGARSRNVRSKMDKPAPHCMVEAATAWNGRP